jgi:hypothetical protein
MTNDIQELLRAARTEAAAAAPPMRHTVDDVVAGGRRRGKRRLIGWATGGVAAAAVLALAVSPTAAPAPAPQPPEDVAAAPLSYPTGEFEVGFAGYSVGPFEVSAPILVTPGYQESFVRRDHETENLYGEGNVVVASSPGFSALLTVYRPGVFQPSRFATGEQVDVHGRLGRYSTDVTYQAGDGPDPRAALAWQYADNAWAVVSVLTPTLYSRAELITIAGGLTGAPAARMAVAFKPTWTPPGYVLTSAGTTDDYPNGGPYMVSSLRLVRTRPAYHDLTQTVDAAKNAPTVRIALYPKAFTDATHQHPGSAAYCNPGNADLCFRMTADGQYLAEVFSSGGLPQTDLRKILDGLQFAQIPDHSTWFPVTP